MNLLFYSALFVNAALPCKAALFSGSPSEFEFAFRDDFGQDIFDEDSPNFVATTEISTNFTASQLGPTSITSSTVFTGGAALSSRSVAFVNQTTLELEIFEVTTTIASFNFTLDLNQAAIGIFSDPFGGEEVVSTPTVAAATVELIGSYQIQGPTSFVEGDFSFNSNDLVADGLLVTSPPIGPDGSVSLSIGTFNLPDSLRLRPFDSFFIGFSGSSRNAEPVLFQEVVDGQTITNHLTRSNFTFRSADLEPVPEPSTGLSILLALALLVRRRR